MDGELLPSSSRFRWKEYDKCVLFWSSAAHTFPQTFYKSFPSPIHLLQRWYKSTCVHSRSFLIGWDLHFMRTSVRRRPENPYYHRPREEQIGPKVYWWDRKRGSWFQLIPMIDNGFGRRRWFRWEDNWCLDLLALFIPFWQKPLNQSSLLNNWIQMHEPMTSVICTYTISYRHIS